MSSTRTPIIGLGVVNNSKGSYLKIYTVSMGIDLATLGPYKDEETAIQAVGTIPTQVALGLVPDSDHVRFLVDIVHMIQKEGE